MKLLLVLPLVLANVYGQYYINPWTAPVVRSWDPRIYSSWVAPRTVYSDLSLHTPVITHAPAVIPAPISVPTSSQYHAQDELGQFAFGHRGDNQARDEVKSFDGSVRGAYSYVDPTGKLVNVQYLADDKGFRVLGANNLPVAPALPAPVELRGPEPVKDTPEVIAARADFEKKFAEARALDIKEEVKEEVKPEEKKEEEKSRKKRDLLWSTPYVSAPLWTHRTVLGAHPYVGTIPIAPVAPVLPLAKTVVKTAELKPIEDAKTPAATKKAEIEEKSHEIVSPLGTPLGTYLFPGTRTIVLSKDEKDKIEKIFSPIPLAHSTILLK